jgi:hypothetical protein
MNRKVVIILILLVVAGVFGGFFFYKGKHAHPPVTATIRISISPAEKADYVADKARSPYFKYLMMKKTGIKPALSQHLQIQQTPGSPVLVGTIGVESREDGKKYTVGFVETLQEVCGKEAQVEMVESKVD